MIIAREVSIGLLFRTYTIEFENLKSYIKIRKVGSNFIVTLHDDVPDEVSKVDYLKARDLYFTKGEHQALKFLDKQVKKLDIERDTVLAIWNRWINYYGALTSFLLCEHFSDIYISSSNIYVMHFDFGLCYTDFVSTPHMAGEQIVEFLVSKVAERTRSPVTAYMPTLSVTDRELRARFSISIPPVSDPYIHVRLMPRKPWTFPELVERDSLTIDDAALLWFLFDRKIPILIVGPMGSGKTSLANAIAFTSNPSSFKAIISDVDEMYLPYHNVIKLFERRSYGLGIKSIKKDELIAHALRTGVDYIIVNEVRTRDEVRAWLDAVTTGHGGVTTFHANDISSLRIRLENMIGTDKILNEVAVVVMQVEKIPEDKHGIRVLKNIRRISKIYLPKSIDVDTVELEVRKTIIAQMLNLNVRQQVSILEQFYSRIDELIEKLYEDGVGAGGGI